MYSFQHWKPWSGLTKTPVTVQRNTQEWTLRCLSVSDFELQSSGLNEQLLKPLGPPMQTDIIDNTKIYLRKTISVKEQSYQNALLYLKLEETLVFIYLNYHYSFLQHGIPDERIIVLMFDDIANNRRNPTPGQIINQPGGSDVYHGVPKVCACI